MKFAFIHAEKASFPVAALCRLLSVTRQGYYAYAKRPPSARTRADGTLEARVKALHTDNRLAYGSPRIQRALRREGMHVGKRRIERMMQGLGLRGQPARRTQRTTRSNPHHEHVENVLHRDFSASRPNERWVTDITYVWTAEGWCYLAAILDLYSRRVVGWALDATLSTSLARAALEMAFQRRKPGRGLLHHSDRGCQYTSNDYRAVLREHGVTVSMSRKGNCWDNAVAESFFATLKTELIHTRPWATRFALRTAVFDYIEVFYNRKRLHSTLDYKTPAEVEAEFDLHQAA